MLRVVRDDLVTFWRWRHEKFKKNLDITIKWFEKIKEINKSLSENDNSAIEDTFWSTEVNFGPISANEGSLCVSNAVLVHLQWSQTEYGVKKPSSSSVECLKTDAISNTHFWVITRDPRGKNTSKMGSRGHNIDTRNTSVARGMSW